MTVQTVVRFFSPRLAQHLELRRKERETRPRAYTNAREVCSVAGPVQVASDLGLRAEKVDSIEELRTTLRYLAGRFAEDYHPQAQAAAAEGALDGFNEWLDRLDDD